MASHSVTRSPRVFAQVSGVEEQPGAVILLRTALQLCNKITAGVCAGQSAAPGAGEIICYGVTDFREKNLALQREALRVGTPTPHFSYGTFGPKTP